MKLKQEIKVKCKNCKNYASCIVSLVSDVELDSMAEYKTITRYRRGQAIFNEGFVPYYFYCILKGDVKLSKIGLKKAQIIRFAGPGSVIGYRSLLANENYSTTATAISDVWVCGFPKSYFLSELNYNIVFSNYLMNLLAKDIKVADDLALNLTQKSGLNRIADAILKINDFYGIDLKTKSLNVSLSRNEMASIACVSTESCIRMLAQLKRLGVINLINRKIQILDLNQLKVIANSK